MIVPDAMVKHRSAQARNRILPLTAAASPDVTPAQRELWYWRRRLLFDSTLASGAVYPRGAKRSYLRLPSRAGCEAWLICWPPGARSPLHDHGGASALATMLSGELHETLQSPEDQRWSQRVWHAYEAIELPADTRHEVWNASDVTAYSLHVYAPRLASMTFYERLRDGEVLALRHERADQW